VEAEGACTGFGRYFLVPEFVSSTFFALAFLVAVDAPRDSGTAAGGHSVPATWSHSPGLRSTFVLGLHALSPTQELRKPLQVLVPLTPKHSSETVVAPDGWSFAATLPPARNAATAAATTARVLRMDWLVLGFHSCRWQFDPNPR
jgi:hypothetical protein